MCTLSLHCTVYSFCEVLKTKRKVAKWLTIINGTASSLGCNHEIPMKVGYLGEPAFLIAFCAQLNKNLTRIWVNEDHSLYEAFIRVSDSKSLIQRDRKESLLKSFLRVLSVSSKKERERGNQESAENCGTKSCLNWTVFRFIIGILNWKSNCWDCLNCKTATTNLSSNLNWTEGTGPLSLRTKSSPWILPEQTQVSSWTDSMDLMFEFRTLKPIFLRKNLSLSSGKLSAIFKTNFRRTTAMRESIFKFRCFPSGLDSKLAR